MNSGSVRKFGVRVGANILYHLGAISVLQGCYKQRQAVRRTPSGEVEPFLILLYHRVNPDDDPLFPAITVSVFEKQMRYLARRFHVLALGEIIHRIDSGIHLEPLTVAITFDDGYLDNYTFAHPVLKKYELPATVFVATGYIGTGANMWNDRLAWSIKNTARTTIKWRGTDREFLFPLGTTEEKVRSFTALLEQLKLLPEEEKRVALRNLIDALDNQRLEPPRLMLDWADLRKMAQQGWEIGAHTVTHPILTRIGLCHATCELRVAKSVIEDALEQPVNLCAFPNGKRSDFSANIKAITKEVGYQAAVTTLPGVNDRRSDLFELRRLSIWETHLATLACKLTKFYGRTKL